MDDFNNMGGDPGVKADINVVDAPTAQNVVMDAPETVAEPAGFKVQSQEDYFANSFGYVASPQPDTNSNAAFGDANASGTGNFNGANTYGGSGNYGNAGYYNGTNNYGSTDTYGSSSNYNVAGNYAGANTYGAGNYNGTNPYGGANNYSNANTYGNAYGSADSYNAAGGGSYGYKTPTDSYGGYNAGYSSNQEYSGPDYYDSNVYANDAFASSYYDDEPERKGNGLAIGALVCGIVSVTLTCSGAGIVPGIIAIILGIRGAKVCEKTRMANIGMILGIVGSVINLIRLAAFILQLTTSIMEYI